MEHDPLPALLRHMVALAGSQQAVAERLGVSREYVSQVMRGVCVPRERSPLRLLAERVAMELEYMTDE